MFDEIFLDLTALVSFVMAVALLWMYPRRKQIHGLLWATAAIVFSVTALLLAAYD